MLVRTDHNKKMFDLHQSPGRKVKSTDISSLNVVLKELREEIRLKIYPSRAKWIRHDEK